MYDMEVVIAVRWYVRRTRTAVAVIHFHETLVETRAC